MKLFFAVLILAGLSYGGYLYYQQSKTGITKSVTSLGSQSKSNLIFAGTNDKLGSLASVLGASVSNTYENSKDMLSKATDGASEPVINQIVTNTTEALKDLPRQQAEKIKYEFCKDVVTEYENKSVVKGVTP